MLFQALLLDLETVKKYFIFHRGNIFREESREKHTLYAPKRKKKYDFDPKFST